VPSTGYFDDFTNEADMAKYAEVKAKQRNVESVKEREERFERGVWVRNLERSDATQGKLTSRWNRSVLLSRREARSTTQSCWDTLLDITMRTATKDWSACFESERCLVFLFSSLFFDVSCFFYIRGKWSV
jgi:hypothetical protein